MEQKRRKRYTPDRSRTTFVDSAEKREILELLAQYKYLRSSSIQVLLPHRGFIGLRRTLRTLFDIGLLTKPDEQRKGYNSLHSPDIYMLTPKGERFLLDRNISPKTITRLYRKMTEGPVRNFAHSMMICDTLSSIQAGAKEAGVEFIPWTDVVARTDHPNPMKLPFSISHKQLKYDAKTRLWSIDPSGKHETVSDHAISDGLFGLRYPDGNVSFFILEAEHGTPVCSKTLHRNSYFRKFLAYRDIIKSEVYKDQLKIPNLRVLVVAPSANRISSMINVSELTVGSTNAFLFHDIPVQEDLMRAPPPFPELFTAELRRVGKGSVTLSES